MSCVVRKPARGVSDMVRKTETNQAVQPQMVQPQKMGRDLQFRIWEEEGLYYLCSKNKGTDQLRSYYAFAKRRFSHDADKANA